MPDTPVSWLAEFQANTTDVGAAGRNQANAATAQLDNGNIVVIWDDNSSAAGDINAGRIGDLTGQLYDPLGVPIGGEFQANTMRFADDEGDPSVARDGFAAGFVVAYTDTDANGTGIVAERWSTDDNGVTTSIGRDIAFDPGDETLFSPIVAANAFGTYVVAYSELDLAAPSTTIKVVAVDPSNVVGAPLTITSDNRFHFANLDVVALADGTFGVVFETEFIGANGLERVVGARKLDGNGAPTGSGFFLAGSNVNDLSDTDPAVAQLSNGNLVTTWVQDGEIVFSVDTDDFGATFTNAVQVNPGVPNNVDPDVAALADGGFVITYTDIQDGTVNGQRFGAFGTAIGEEFVVKTSDGGFGSFNSAVLGLEDGRFLTAATTSVPFENSDNLNVVAQIFDPRDAPNVPAVYMADGFQIGTIGDDVFTVDASADVAHGHDGDDVIVGNAFSPTIFGDDGNDTISMASAGGGYDGGDGLQDTIIVLDGVLGFGAFIELGANGQGVGLIDGVGIANFENATGSSQSENIIGDAGDNILRGGGGDDDIDPGAGADQVFGDDGDDTVTRDSTAAPMTNSYDGGADDDTIFIDGPVMTGAPVSTTFVFDLEEGTLRDEFGGLIENWTNFENYTGASLDTDETVRGTSGRNIFQGGSGDNTFEGRGDIDTLLGFAGADTLMGGDGDDNIDGGLGDDMMDGGAGTGDLANYASATGSGVTVRLDFGTATGALGNDTLSGFENVMGSGFADVIFGDNGANELSGGSGADQMDGRGGADTLNGDAGDDSMRGFGGDDVLNGGDDDDRLIGDSGTDQLLGDAGADVLVGGSGDDFLTGGDDSDRMFGGSGADFYFGELGVDRMFERSDGAADRFDGGDGIDEVNYLNERTLGATIDLQSQASNAGAAAGDTFVDIERIFGTAVDDVISGSDADETFGGGGGDDMLKGRGGIDLLRGDQGADRIFDGDGNDRVFAGVGNDSVTLGAGADRIFTEAGFDRIFLSVGMDVDRIEDFDLIGDRISVVAFGITDFAGVQAILTDVSGDARLTFGGGDLLILTGIASGDLSSGDFIYAT